MWFAARDIAFENPVTEDETQTDARPHGHRRAADGTPPTPEAMPPCAAEALRRFADLDLALEMMVRRMIGLLLHRDLRLPQLRVGRGACSSDTDLVAGDGEAAALVSLHPGRRDARTSPTCAPR